MNTPNDGGPAFPCSTWELKDGVQIGTPVSGMSLRDWFAGLAMQQMCAGPGARMVADQDDRYDQTNWKYIVASNAYMFADAMIAERSKPTK